MDGSVKICHNGQKLKSKYMLQLIIKNDYTFIMSKDTYFGIKDISDFRIDVNYNSNIKQGFRDVIKSLEITNFTTTTIESIGVLNYLLEQIPSLHLSGKGFDIVVNEKKISLSFLDGGELVLRQRSKEDFHVDTEKLFSKENLKLINTDFNFVVGLLLGKLGFDTSNTTIESRLSVNKEGKFKTTFTHLLSPESKLLFAQCIDTNLVGINLEMTENLLNTQAKTRYNIGTNVGIDNKPDVYCRLRFEVSNKGIIDSFTFMEAMLNKANSVVNMLTGGLLV